MVMFVLELLVIVDNKYVLLYVLMVLMISDIIRFCLSDFLSDIIRFCLNDFLRKKLIYFFFRFFCLVEFRYILVWFELYWEDF